MNFEVPDISLFCCYCGRQFRDSRGSRKTTDHLIPLSKGGANNYYNKRNCCQRCNTQKADMMPQDYLKFIQDRITLRPNHYLHIKEENIQFIIQYVNTAGEKLFKNKERYVWYERRYLNQSQLK